MTELWKFIVKVMETNLNSHKLSLKGNGHIKMCVYLITCTISGKKYVGRTKRTLSKRWSQHKYTAFNGGKSCPALSAAIVKYGFHNFHINILEICDSLESLYESERKWVEIVDCISPKGYNLTNGGEFQTITSDETKAKQRAAKLGTVQTEETIEKRKKTLKVIHDDPDFKKKMSLARKGRKQTAEWSEKRASKHRGFKFSHEQKINLARAHMKGRKIICSNGRVFYSTYEASFETGVKQKKITKICNGRYNPKDNELSFEYMSES